MPWWTEHRDHPGRRAPEGVAAGVLRAQISLDLYQPSYPPVGAYEQLPEKGSRNIAGVTRKEVTS